MTSTEAALFDPELCVPDVVAEVPHSGDGFHPAVQAWFDRTFVEGPTEPQSQGWHEISAGFDTLIAAPTGSGKTLAGFLVTIDRLYRLHSAGADLEATTHVVYVSPLKALAVDISENLQRPLNEIAEISEELGFGRPAITVGVRTGDTTQSERAAMVRRPPNFLVTTPESLFLMVTAERSRNNLTKVETVIIDEIHAVAGDKRGVHLALTVERLELLAEVRPQRIGLSATQRPIALVAEMLVGSNPPAPTSIVDVGHKRTMDLAIEVPSGELEAVSSADQMSDVIDRIAELVGEHHTTIVFVNARRMAERLAHQLAERVGEDRVAAHHGSLSKDRRHMVESRLRAGDLSVLVATASLELGIDIGPIELVCQLGSPRSIATFLQRVGRSGHSRAGTPKGRLFPLTRDELVECAGLLRATEAGHLDAIIPSIEPLDILAQQLIAEVAAVGDTTTTALFELVRRARPYKHLSRETFDEVLDLIADGVVTGRGRRAAYVYLDRVNDEVRPRKGARLAALTSGGAIPEIGDFRVLLEPDDLFVGTVNEDWAVESMAGDIFLLGSHSWQIRQVVSGVVRVADAGGKPPTIPFWTGEAPARTSELSQEVSAVRTDVSTDLDCGGVETAVASLMATDGIDAAAAEQIVSYIAAGRAALGEVPSSDTLVFERFFDESDGMHLVVHSPHGGRINRAFGLALRKRFCKSFNFELQAAASDDAFVLSLGPHHSFPLESVPAFLNSESVDTVLRQAVLDSPMFQSRWRWNLNRSLIVLRFRGGKKNPPPIQRMESDDLMAALFPQAAACQENIAGPIDIPDHPIVRQTMHDTLHEGLDSVGLATMLKRIEDGDIRVVFRDTTEASPFSHEILTAKPYAFLDDGEIQDRRTNAVPLRRGLPVDLENIGRLDPDAIQRVRTEVEPVPLLADELFDVIESLVVTPARESWRALYVELADRGRVGSTRVTPDASGGRGSGTVEYWYPTTDAARAEALLFNIDSVELPLETTATEVLRGHLDISGPVTADELADATGLSQRLIASGLAALESQGFAISGHFSDPAAPLEWSSRRLLARMHSYSRKERRRSIEASSAQDFMRFLLRWQHVAPGTQLRGPHAVSGAIEQLQGFEVGAGSWEPEILERRIAAYTAAGVDRLCNDGELTWLRLSLPATSGPKRSALSKATPITLAFREDMDWLLQAVRGDTVAEVPELGATAEVVELLSESGARFLTELVDGTSRLPADIEQALWDGVSKGLIHADGFAAVRSLIRGRAKAVPSRSLSRRRRGRPAPHRGAGRWSLVPKCEPIPRDELAEAVADQLLARWGVVIRDLAVHDSFGVPWREIQWALRRLEDRGVVRGGRFVSGFSGEQYALPTALDTLKATVKLPRTGESVTLNATDPLNLTGVLFSGDRVTAVRTNTVTFVDGVPVDSST